VDLAVNDVKKMPKGRKTFGGSQKRGGNRKLGDGGEGIAYMPPVAPTKFAVALQPDTRGTSITPSNQMKYIPKKTCATCHGDSTVEGWQDNQEHDNQKKLGERGGRMCNR